MMEGLKRTADEAIEWRHVGVTREKGDKREQRMTEKERRKTTKKKNNIKIYQKLHL